MTLTSEAAAAYEAVLVAEASKADSARKALRQAALDAVKAVLVRPDGTSLTMAEAGVKPVDTDLANGLVVVGDGTSHLAAQLRDDRWVVVVVEQVDGRWTRVGDRVRTLADVGAVLAAK